MVLLRDPDGGLLLERRPPAGIWGGLWSLPELADDDDPLAWCTDRFGRQACLGRRLQRRRHTFSHFHLDISPVEILLNGPGSRVLDGEHHVWYNPAQPSGLGLAAPVARLIDEINR
jgi:A/G-specific adenine glycosylase